MKKDYALFVLLFIGFIGKAQIISFPDTNLKARLLSAGPNSSIAQDAGFNYIAIDTNNDGEIQVSEALQVRYLNVSNANITNLTGITNFSNLYGLFFSDNQVSNADLSSMVSLQRIGCNFNQLTSLNVSGLTNLISLTCRNNQLQNLDISGLTSLTSIECSWNNVLQNLNLSGATAIESISCYQNQLSSLDLTSFSNLQVVNCWGNQLQTLNVNGLTNLLTLSCDFNQLTSINLTGLPNLQTFTCANNQIPNLDLTGLSNLESLNCSDNLLTSLDLSPLDPLVLRYLLCSNNQISVLNVTGFNRLWNFKCDGNLIETLDLTGKVYLHEFDCHDNQIHSLEINGLTSLTNLNCSNNLLTSLTISNLSNIWVVDCSYNQLTTLDLSSFYCNSLNCSNNQLTTLFIKNGISETPLDFSANPNLEYICADEGQISDIQTAITANGNTNCHVNSYCSFIPGGTVYSIQGNNRYDENSNGCTIADAGFPNLKLSFSDGSNTGNLISDESGAYHYEVQYGTHTIAPILENPTYFTVSPNSVVVDFPNQLSPFGQDFCIAPNGVHNDLEIEVVPLNAARPGFDTYYKISYKNKGTHEQNGSITLTFNDAVLDFVSSNPMVNTQSTSNLTWSFSNLAPFETAEILFTLNVNSPVEIPAVNSGDVLSFTATVVGSTDETPIDNTAALNQTVFNSFDPNDKTCLEGTTITPSMVGQYVHYIIRFENTGTFPAENIVVADIIDSAKFDLTTLIPQSSSHSFVTRINNATNKVEFIFENINLPFDNANNDGYVAFKIKTKPTLVVGNTFSNSASIYFDYNFPIVTNNYVTTVQALGSQDFNFNNVFSLSPVPTKDVLTITAKENVVMTSVSIYNQLGQLVQVNTNPNETIDISGLSGGSYFIKIISDKGSSSGKFIIE